MAMDLTGENHDLSAPYRNQWNFQDKIVFMSPVCCCNMRPGQTKGTMVRFVLKFLYLVDDYEDYVLIYLFSNRQSWIQNSTVIEHAAAKKISMLLVQSNHTYDRMGWITLVASIVITIFSGSKGQILIWCLIQLRRWELTPESGTHPWVIRRGTGKWPIEIWFSQRKKHQILT